MVLIEVKQHHITATRIGRMPNERAAFLPSVVGRPREGHRLDTVDDRTGRSPLRTENIESVRFR